MKTLTDVARTKLSVTGDVEAAHYDHALQRRNLDLTAQEIKHCYKSSTMFDGEGSNEADR